MLKGIEDLPVIADEFCGQCGKSLTIINTLDNFSGWFGFMKIDSQMYQIPLCYECDFQNSNITAKVDE